MTVPAVIDFIAVNADPIVEERAMDLNFNLEAQRATLATFIWRTRVLSLVFVCLALLSGCRICPTARTWITLRTAALGSER